MNFDDLALFVLTAEQANLSVAGRSLGLSPAVASARLARLERQLGVELLRRSTRKSVLSVDGEAFLPFAREMLLQREGALAALGGGKAELSGTLRFAASSSFAQLYVMPLLPAFLREHSKLNVDLRLTDLPHDPIEGSYDVALRNAPLPDSHLRSRKLADDQRILCAAPAYLAAHGTPTSLAALDAHQLIAFRGMAGAKRLVTADGREGLFDPRRGRRQIIVDDGMSQKALTVAGGGLSLNSWWIVHRDIHEGRLVRVLPEFSVSDGAALWLVYPSANLVSPKVRALIDFLVVHLGDGTAWQAPSSR